MYKIRFISIGFTLLLFWSCSGLDDLIFDRHPILEPMQVSSTRVAPFDTVFASIKAENPIDGLLEYKWTVKRVGSALPSNGTIDGPSDQDSVRWIAPIDGGVYELKVKVSNTAKDASDATDIEVLVSEVPFVSIQKPGAGEYFVAGATITIETRAEHANGLSWVKAFINGSLIEQKNQNLSGIYTFNVIADSSMVGQPFIRIEAKSKTVVETGADSIQVEIGGIIPGKNGI